MSTQKKKKYVYGKHRQPRLHAMFSTVKEPLYTKPLTKTQMEALPVLCGMKKMQKTMTTHRVPARVFNILMKLQLMPVAERTRTTIGDAFDSVHAAWGECAWTVNTLIASNQKTSQLGTYGKEVTSLNNMVFDYDDYIKRPLPKLAILREYFIDKIESRSSGKVFLAYPKFLYKLPSYSLNSASQLTSAKKVVRDAGTEDRRKTFKVKANQNPANVGTRTKKLSPAAEILTLETAWAKASKKPNKAARKVESARKAFVVPDSDTDDSEDEAPVVFRKIRKGAPRPGLHFPLPEKRRIADDAMEYTNHSKKSRFAGPVDGRQLFGARL